jgi:membrane-associated protein
MEPLGLVAIVVLLAVKEAGVPIPVPGDLVVIGAGAAAAAGSLDPRIALPAIVAATIAGGLVQYALIRRGGRRLILAILGRVGVTAERLEPIAGRFRRAGGRGVAVARGTPGVRILAIPAAAIAPVAALPFGLGLAVGNGLFTSAHFALGMAIGPSAASVLGGLGAAIVVIVAVLAIVGLVGWRLIVQRRGSVERGTAALEAWADAACPACLALGWVGREGVTG